MGSTVRNKTEDNRFYGHLGRTHSLLVACAAQGIFVWRHDFLLPPAKPSGGSHEGYCKWACASAYAQGWRAVVLNYRGCNGVPLTAPRGYAATLTHDVARAVASIKGCVGVVFICVISHPRDRVPLRPWKPYSPSKRLGAPSLVYMRVMRHYSPNIRP